MKAKVNQETCIGCGVCADVCPAVFRMNGNEKVEVITETVGTGSVEDCRSAAQSCPVEAISIEE